MELEEFNAFAKAARDIPRSEVPKLKALLEQFEVRDIETALFLTEHLADYVLTPDLSSPQETAIDHLRFMTDDHSAELLLSHVNLYAYAATSSERTTPHSHPTACCTVRTISHAVTNAGNTENGDENEITPP